MKELDDIIKRLRKAAELAGERDGEIIDLTKERTFVKGPFLHQDADGMSEEKSAEFERENQDLFNFLRDFDDQMRRVF